VIIDENLAEKSNSKSILFRKLLTHDLISEVRGEGLFLAVQLIDPSYINYVIAHAPEHGLVLDYFLFCYNSFRIAPPLIIEDDEIITACNNLNNLLDDAGNNKNIK
jgi:acetylornithine/succinyldiaminopimelate/putrescine aminotransferase